MELHNRIRPEKRYENKSTPGIKQRLQKVINNLSVDVFGYEKKVVRNVAEYFKKASEQEQVAPANLFIRINKQGLTVRVFLHQKGQFLKEIPVNELVDFFTGQGAARLLGIEHSVVQRVSSYLQEFAEDHEIELEHLNVLISYNGKMVIIDAYHHNEPTREIPLSELINYFKK